MIHDVRVTTYTPDGIVKKTITAKSLMDKIWEDLLESKHATRSLEAGPIKTCLLCHRKFEGVPYSKFCSLECGKKNVKINHRKNYIARALVEYSNAEMVDGKLIFNIQCRVCKRMLKMLTANAVFCSRKCASNRYNDKYIKRIRDEVKAENAIAESQPTGHDSASASI